MADTGDSRSFFDWLRKIAIWVSSQLYFLRFPVLTAVAMVGLPYLGLRTQLKSLLASLFVSDARGIALVSAVAFSTAGAILVTWRLIALYGDERFSRENETAAFSGDRQKQPPVFSIKLWQALLASVTALPVIIAVIYKTVHEDEMVHIPPHVGWGQAILAAVAGLLGSLLVFFLAVVVQLMANPESRARELAHQIFIVRWLPESVINWIAIADRAKTPRRAVRKILQRVLGKGFFDEYALSSSGGRFLPGHGFAASLLFISLLVFIVLGQFSQHFMLELPALFFVVLLLMLLCWGLSALSFLVDRYRIPVLGILLFIAYAASPNYFYNVQNDGALQPLTPQEVIGAGERIIVVATEGGGIQASAWTARVLTGLQREAQTFGKAVRVISSVSGGSTGALFFTNGYKPELGVPDDQSLDLILEMAAGNSLDDVARGLVYHDFIHTVFPLWDFGDDRGTALEKSWAKNCRKVCDDFRRQHPDKDCPVDCAMAGTLAGWAEDVKAGRRPANIFNATVVETGDRLLVSNTDIEHPMDQGRLNVRELLGGKDVQAATSARLSATFPYVSPAARAVIGGPVGARRHVVDGGYYDNYGMTSMVEWLDRALENERLTVLVIQIQSFDDPPKASEANRSDKPENKTDSGYISQLLAPIYTLLNIRTAAQASHKELEFDLLRGKYNPPPDKDNLPEQSKLPERPKRIDNTLFKFRCGEAPLTWKLTETEKKRIRDCWERDYANSGDPNNPTNVVKRFLAEPPPPNGQINH